jgi:tetratricopeptide (TPR) repeat protein
MTVTTGVGLALVSLFVLAGTKLCAAEIVTQTTGQGSSCSPAQNGTGNIIVLVCNGVDPRAVARLNELLDLKDLSLKQKIAEANEWARKYTALSAQLDETKHQLAAKGEDATAVQTAQDLLHEGKLDDARAIFDHLIQSDEANVERAAQNYFNRAIVFQLQFRADKALPDYAKAHQYRPDELRYALAYASALVEQKDFFSAETVLREQLPQLRATAAQSPTYRLKLAEALVNLGTVYRRTRRFGEAENSFREAIGIWRELVVKDPVYQAGLAVTLIDLGNLYSDTGHHADAEIALKEAVVIERSLAVQNAPVHRANLATTLNNLGALYRDMGQFGSAEATLKEAEGIWRDLALQQPGYRSEFARTLDNQGTLYVATKRFEDAEKPQQEATQIWRELASQNSASRPDFAMTLGDLGRLYLETDRLTDAANAFEGSIVIWRQLVLPNSTIYRPDFARALGTLAEVYLKQNRTADSVPILEEAVGNLRKLTVDGPFWQKGLRVTLLLLAETYRQLGENSDADAATAEAAKIPE